MISFFRKPHLKHPDTDTELVIDILNRDHVALKGKRKASEFTNSFTDVYFDVNRIIYHPKDFQSIVDKLDLIYKKISHGNKIPVCGLATAGISFATALALKNNVPLMYARKQPKGYGTNSYIEGGIDPHKPVILIDDVIADPRQTLPFIDILHQNNLKIIGLICVLEVLPPKISKQVFQDQNIPIHSILNYQQTQKLIPINEK